MAQETWLLFFVVSSTVVLTPGPTMLAILGHAVGHGVRPTLPVVLGNAFGALLWVGVSVAGLAAVVESVPYGLIALKGAGTAYLLWLGLRSFRVNTAAREAAETSARPGRTGGAFARGLLIALSNPKALLFFAAVLPQFVDRARPALPQFAALATTFVGLELAVTSAVAFAAHALTPVLRRATVARRMSRAGGTVMIAAAALLALSPSS